MSGTYSILDDQPQAAYYSSSHPGQLLRPLRIVCGPGSALPPLIGIEHAFDAQSGTLVSTTIYTSELNNSDQPIIRERAYIHWGTRSVALGGPSAPRTAFDVFFNRRGTPLGGIWSTHGPHRYYWTPADRENDAAGNLVATKWSLTRSGVLESVATVEMESGYNQATGSTITYPLIRITDTTHLPRSVWANIMMTAMVFQMMRNLTTEPSLPIP